MSYLTNKEIYNRLSQRVYGHDRAKRILITAFNRLRAYHQAKEDGVQEDYLPVKTNLLLVGDSGTGKTYMVNQLSKIVGVPYVELDASKFTSTGSVSGKTAQEIEDSIDRQLTGLRQLYSSKSKIGIVFIDEIDKISSYYDGSSAGKWNVGVQGDFLKLIEKISENNLVIFSGAFDNMLNKVAKKVDTKQGSLGFVKGSSSKEEKTKDMVLQDEVNNFGFLPELLGRMGLIVGLDQLAAKDYVRLAKDQIVPQLVKTSEYLGLNIRIPASYIKGIAERAVKSGQGVRYLKSKLSEYSLEREFKGSCAPKAKEVALTTYNAAELEEFILSNFDKEDIK